MITTTTTIKELREGLRRRTFSVHDIQAYYRERIKRFNPKLNSFIEIFADQPAQTENASDGILAGIPFVAKDLFLQKGRIASAGSRILANYKAPYDATVISRVTQAGAVSFGRANMDEFAMGGSGEYSAYGITHNPWDHTRSPGGSSSGSAAAVAAGLVPFAFGSETGGSIRQPASFCNLVGMYPTYGLHSRYGMMAFASSSDQPGVFTKTVYDSALVMSAISGHDPHDSTSIAISPKDYTHALTGKIKPGLKIGVLKDIANLDGMDEQVLKVFEAGIEQMRKLGAQITYVDLPHLKYGIAIYFIVSRAEAASNLSRYDGSLYGVRSKEAQNLMDMYFETRQQGFGNEVKRRILTGNFVLSSVHKRDYYDKAMQVRGMIRAELEDVFKHVDVLSSPTSSSLPFVLGSMTGDPIAMYLSDYFVLPNNMAGTPAISIPCGFSREGLPIGFQFLGPRLSESLLFQVAHAYEQHTQLYQKVAPGYE